MDYENEFWDLYDNDYETGMKLENIMEVLGITPTENSDGTFSLSDDEYREVVKAFYNKNKKPLTDDEFIEQVREALESEFDNVRTFEEVGMMTMNNGIVINYAGKEYQLELLGSHR